MVGAADDTRTVLGRAAMTPLPLLMASDQGGLLDRPRLLDKHALYLYFAFQMTCSEPGGPHTGKRAVRLES